MRLSQTGCIQQKHRHVGHGESQLYVIKHAKFGDDRLRGSGVVAGQISAFPIDFAGRPYNTLTLPCERVIQLQIYPGIFRGFFSIGPELTELWS